AAHPQKRRQAARKRRTRLSRWWRVYWLELRPELGLRLQRRSEPDGFVRVRAAVSHATRAHVQRRPLRRRERQWLAGDSRFLRGARGGTGRCLLHREKDRTIQRDPRAR